MRERPFSSIWLRVSSRRIARGPTVAIPILALIGGAAWIRSSCRADHSATPEEPVIEDSPTTVTDPAHPTLPEPLAPSARTATVVGDAAAVDSEQAFMDRLRRADPAGVERLATEGAKKYRHGAFADERESRRVDALLALGQLNEAHYRAQLFVQHFPHSPYAIHVMNLMGVHPRPPGVVPEPPDEPQE